MRNPCLRMRPQDKPYEIWRSWSGDWQWHVLKKWQVKDDKPHARWFCKVYSPYMPEGEMGDVYVSDIKSHAIKVKEDYT